MSTTWTVLTIIGWVTLITSWVLPRFIKSEFSKSYWGGVISAFALGVFISAAIVHMMK